jgi:hypothetical protein
MQSNSQPTIHDLAASVTALTEAVSQSEGRRRSSARALRWLGLGAVLLVVSGLYLGAGAMRSAEAANEDAAAIARQLAQLNETIGQMAQGMGQMMQSPGFRSIVDNGGTLAERLKQDSDAIRFLMFCQMNGLAIADCSRQIRSGELEAPPGAAPVDVTEAPEAMALMQNLASIEKISQVLGAELEKLNAVLRSVPEMRGEMAMMRHDMNVMAGQMGVMAGSMGSTMGRMGSWMPW